MKLPPLLKNARESWFVLACDRRLRVQITTILQTFTKLLFVETLAVSVHQFHSSNVVSLSRGLMVAAPTLSTSSSSGKESFRKRELRLLKNKSVTDAALGMRNFDLSSFNHHRSSEQGHHHNVIRPLDDPTHFGCFPVAHLWKFRHSCIVHGIIPQPANMLLGAVY